MTAMSRDERQSRIDELREWFRNQNAEYEDDQFPADVQSAWDQNDSELREHEEAMKNLEARDQRLRDLAKDEESTESVRSQDRGYRTPQLISRMSEREVYDLSNVRSNPFNPAAANGELRQRALRAIDLGFYPTAGRDQERAKEHVTNLIKRGDDEDFSSALVAKRVLATGAPAYRRAFVKNLQSAISGFGGANLTPEEMRAVDLVRAMTVGTGSQGGFAVPFQLDPTVIPTSNWSVNPYRAISRVEQITGNEWRGVSSAGVTAAYAAEAAEASDNSPTLAQPTVTASRAQVFVPISFELTQDWGQVLTELGQLISDAKDDLESDKFTNGTGTNQPQGILVGATTTVSTTTNDVFAIADLYKLEEAVPPRFRPRSSMIANRFIYNKIRQFDTAGGSGVWLPNLQVGIPNNVPTSGNTGYNVIGYPAFEASALPASVADATKIIVMGDFRHYLIVDRIGMDLEVIPHLFGAAQRPTGQRGLYGFWRNGAVVLSTAAFRTLVIA